MTLVLEPRSNISVSILNGAVADVFKDLGLPALDLQCSACGFIDVNLIVHLALLLVSKPHLCFRHSGSSKPVIWQLDGYILHPFWEMIVAAW